MESRISSSAAAVTAGTQLTRHLWSFKAQPEVFHLLAFIRRFGALTGTPCPSPQMVETDSESHPCAVAAHSRPDHRHPEQHVLNLLVCSSSVSVSGLSEFL